ncbi:YbjQ family protein [Acidithiobacillus ferrooxidans]|uniref:YbjQ family protein n=1 Tax=Acidithiobacillus ferrooxidans TaxID=920 RepID=UPI001D00F1B1|nr:YbjQ family protein [Acidithiobacillus ferrooxidans]
MSASTEANSVLILTINDCPGMRVVRVIGPVYGTGVRSRNIVGNLLGGMRALFGGKQAGYLKMIAQTRDDALEQLAEHARSLGANAVLGMRFDSGEDEDSYSTGTAIDIGFPLPLPPTTPNFLPTI